jgi:hypothetical protein
MTPQAFFGRGWCYEDPGRAARHSRILLSV